MPRTEGKEALLPIQGKLGAEQVDRTDDGDEERAAVSGNPGPSAKRTEPRRDVGNNDHGNAGRRDKIGREVPKRVVVVLHCSVLVFGRRAESPNMY